MESACSTCYKTAEAMGIGNELDHVRAIKERHAFCHALAVNMLPGPSLPYVHLLGKGAVEGCGSLVLALSDQLREWQAFAEDTASRL